MKLQQIITVCDMHNTNWSGEESLDEKTRSKDTTKAGNRSIAIIRKDRQKH